jgi:thioredoxin 1
MISIYYFTATWCGPCKSFGPIVDQAARDTGANIQRLDIDLNQSSVLKYDVTSVPTLVFVDNLDGSMLFKKSGVMTKSELISVISKYK